MEEELYRNILNKIRGQSTRGCYEICGDINWWDLDSVNFSPFSVPRYVRSHECCRSPTTLQGQVPRCERRWIWQTQGKVYGGIVGLAKSVKEYTLHPSVRPNILRILELKGSGVVVLQGSDGARVTRQVSQLAYTSYIGYRNLSRETRTHRFGTLPVMLIKKGSRTHVALWQGFHTFYLDAPLREVLNGEWQCETHKVKPKKYGCCDKDKYE